MSLILDGTTGVPVTTVTGTLPVANGGSGVTTSTGSGANVLGTSPTLVTPLLGTPTSGVATNLTGLPLTTGVTGTLPVANGGTGVTTSTGSGANVLGTSPTLTTPVLGTPTSGTLTNCTGLKFNTGVVRYNSGNQTWGASTTTTTLAHGLGVVPSLITLQVKCLTAEGGWSIGDTFFVSINGWTSCIFIPRADATNIYLGFSAVTDFWNTTYGGINATRANWAVIVIAWA